MSLYLMGVYGDKEQRDWFESAWIVSGKKLDMGKSCIRFKSVDNLPLDVIGQAIKRVPVKKFIAGYEATLKSMGKSPDDRRASKRANSRKRVSAAR